jgi:hypothetical protein
MCELSLLESSQLAAVIIIFAASPSRHHLTLMEKLSSAEVYCWMSEVSHEGC